MDFKNTTTLDSNLLRETGESAVAGWPTDPLVVRVRWSRGAEFSGTCVYATHRLYINLGRHLQYPYRMETHCARGRKAWGRYYKPRSFLELCDEHGLYVVDEANVESHALMQTLSKDPRFEHAILDRILRMVRRDRNHPSIILWSLGNESGYGPIHDAARAHLRHLDPTRPVQYEGAIGAERARLGFSGGDAETAYYQRNPDSDIGAPMYP